MATHYCMKCNRVFANKKALLGHPCYNRKSSWGDFESKPAKKKKRK